MGSGRGHMRGLTVPSSWRGVCANLRSSETGQWHHGSRTVRPSPGGLWDTSLRLRGGWGSGSQLPGALVVKGSRQSSRRATAHSTAEKTKPQQGRGSNPCLGGQGRSLQEGLSDRSWICAEGPQVLLGLWEPGAGRARLSQHRRSGWEPAKNREQGGCRVVCPLCRGHGGSQGGSLSGCRVGGRRLQGPPRM